MKLSIKFSGAARAIAGTHQINVAFNEEVTYKDIVHTLAEMYPDLVGAVIGADGFSLLSANFFSVNGDQVIYPDEMDRRPKDGEDILLFSIIVGGSEEPEGKHESSFFGGSNE